MAQVNVDLSEYDMLRASKDKAEAEVKDLKEEVKNYLENASPEQLQQDWKEMEKFDDCGPLAKDFVENNNDKDPEQ